MTDGAHDLQLEIADDGAHRDVDLLPDGDIRLLVELTIAAAGVPGGVIEGGIQLVGADAIRALNDEHRGVDEITDVLSFPIDGLDELPPGVPRQLGDVVICPEHVAQQVADGTTMVVDDSGRPGDADVRAALARCVVHGVLHLLGEDHEDGPVAAEQMFDLEQRVLDSWAGGHD